MHFSSTLLFFILSSVWSHQFYYLFSFLFFNEHKPSLWMLKDALTKAAAGDAALDRAMAAR